MHAVTRRILFAVGEEELGEGEEPLAVILERQLSYFADKEQLNAFLDYLGESPLVPNPYNTP
jgi:hypothetical protein